MPFVKGQSGNPGGRAKGAWSLTQAVKAHVEAHPEDAQAIVAKVIEDAKNGDVAARKMLWDRIDGAVVQGFNITGLMEQFQGAKTEDLQVIAGVAAEPDDS